MSNIKTISVEFFGRQRIITGNDVIEVAINGNANRVEHVLNYVKERYPDLSLNEKTILMVVNQKMVPSGTILKPDDRIAFLPAIGGG